MEIHEYNETYAFVLVKIASARSKTIKPRSMDILIDSKNIDDFKRKLSEMYADTPADLLTSSKDLEQTFHQVFFKYGMNIVKNAPKECQEFLIKYFQKYEVENLKNLLISKLVNVDSSSVKENLFFEVEKMLKTSKLMIRALKSETIEEIIYMYRNTRFHKIIHEIEERYNHTHEVFFVYSLLDKFFIEDFNGLLERHHKWTRSQRDLISFFIGTLTDYYNLSTVFRSINHDFSWNEIELVITSESLFHKITLRDLKSIFEKRKEPNAVAAFQEILVRIARRYQYGSNFEEIFQNSRYVPSLKQFYYNIQLKETNSLRFKGEHGIGEVIMFIIKKEIEIDNLVMIFEGIKNKFDREEIREFLIKEV
ncbi:MAG: V-type ATPase subunit [Promethearchaeota archaeon]